MAGGGLLANMAPRPADADEDERRQRNLAAQIMGDGAGAEVTFAGEVPLESQVYWWHDKYRPRKPKYFNRVHTGYDWNKYNQTHYDHDNPPPKVVQGYKFNIFYPDLIDKAKAPAYEIVPDGSPHGETCVLRFLAGPPYEVRAGSSESCVFGIGPARAEQPVPGRELPLSGVLPALLRAAGHRLQDRVQAVGVRAQARIPVQLRERDSAPVLQLREAALPPVEEGDAKGSREQTLCERTADSVGRK